MMNAVDVSVPVHRHTSICSSRRWQMRFNSPPGAARRTAARGRKNGDGILETGKHPAHSKDDVYSPGGTTIYAVSVLEEYGLRNALSRHVDACYEVHRPEIVKKC